MSAEVLEEARELLALTQGDLSRIGLIYDRLPSIKRVACALLARDWQPIATAPRDGTNVLLSNGNYVVAGRWLRTEELWEYGVGAGYHDEGPPRLTSPASMPTHWMPLPPPPEDEK